MRITPAQCRAARGLLRWTQNKLADRSNVSRPTIKNFERGIGKSQENNAKAIREAFEKAGVRFPESESSEYKDMVALLATVEDADTFTGQEQDTTHGAGGDVQEMVNFWQDNPDVWGRMPPLTRHVLNKRMGKDDGEELFGGAAE